MDILLANSYFLGEDRAEQGLLRVYPPLGILYLSAHLKAKGFDVEVFDSTFRTKQQFRLLLQDKRPPVVGIYCNLITRKHVLEMIADSRASGARVVLGGPEPPLHAAEFIHHGADLVVLGEGEETLAELLSTWAQSRQGSKVPGNPTDQTGGLTEFRRYPVEALSGIAGIAYRDRHGNLVQTGGRPLIRDLDKLPFPDREAIDLEAYLDAWRQKHGLSSVSLITSRGCPYTCTWCSRSVFGETHRRRSPKNVADEVQSIQDRYRPDMLWYADDVFTIHHGWLKQYAAELVRRNLKIPFECISRADRINVEIADLLQKIGCFRL